MTKRGCCLFWVILAVGALFVWANATVDLEQFGTVTHERAGETHRIQFLVSANPGQETKPLRRKRKPVMTFCWLQLRRLGAAKHLHGSPCWAPVGY